MGRKLKTFLSITIVIIFFVVLHYIGWLRPIENFFRNLINPASQIIYTISVKIGEENQEFTSLDNLKTAYVQSQENLLDNRVDIVKLQFLEEENVVLREQLNFLQKSPFETVGAEVIGKNIDPLGNTIILNRGSQDGIIINNPVVVSNGVLVGKVVRVEKNVAVVRLINDNQSKVAATVMNEDKSLGLVEGGYGISVRMNFIPQNELIQVEDTIVTSGLEEGIPKGLLIGTVEAVEKEAYHPFQKAVLKPLTNLDKINLVSVIISQ